MKLNETIITSNAPIVRGEKKFSAPGGPSKVLIFIDAARATAYPLDESHEDFSPDSFEIIKSWVDNTKTLSKHDEEFLDNVKKSSIVELRFGTYTLTSVGKGK